MPVIRPLSVLVLLASLLAAPSVAQRIHASTGGSDDLVEVREGHVVLHLDEEDGASFLELLELFETLLDTPVVYDEAVVADVRVRMLGDLSVPRERLRHVLDKLARAHGLVTWDAAPGEEPLITVDRVRSGHRGGGQLLPHQLVDVDELDATPERVCALYSTAFVLRHADSRSMIAVLAPYLGSDGEVVRAVERTNTMLVTAQSLETLRTIRDMLARVDVEPSADTEWTPLEQRVALLEARVAELEARLAEGASGATR